MEGGVRSTEVVIPGHLEYSSLACGTAMTLFLRKRACCLGQRPHQLQVLPLSFLIAQKVGRSGGRQLNTELGRAQGTLVSIPSLSSKPSLGTKSVLANPLIGWSEEGGELEGSSFSPGLKSQKLTTGRNRPSCPRVASTSHRHSQLTANKPTGLPS